MDNSKRRRIKLRKCRSEPGVWSFVLTIPDSVRDQFCFDVLYNVSLPEYNTTFMLFFATTS